MTTATASLSGQLDKLDASVKKHRAKVNELKRQRDAHLAETDQLRGEYSSRRRTHPEELARNGRPLPDTETARLQDEIRPRVQGTLLIADPEQQKALDKAIAGLHEAQSLEAQFRFNNANAIVAEVEPPMEGVVERFTGAAEELVAAVSDYRTSAEGALEFTYDTEALTGRDLVTDQRITRWLEVAEEILSDPVVAPHISETGHFKIDRARQADQAWQAEANNG